MHLHKRWFRWQPRCLLVPSDRLLLLTMRRIMMETIGKIYTALDRRITTADVEELEQVVVQEEADRPAVDVRGATKALSHATGGTRGTIGPSHGRESGKPTSRRPAVVGSGRTMTIIPRAMFHPEMERRAPAAMGSASGATVRFSPIRTKGARTASRRVPVPLRNRNPRRPHRSPSAPSARS